MRRIDKKKEREQCEMSREFKQCKEARDAFFFRELYVSDLVVNEIPLNFISWLRRHFHRWILTGLLWHPSIGQRVEKTVT